MSTAVLHQFTIRTHAETRAKGKRDRVWFDAAETADEAIDAAVVDHMRVAGCRGRFFTGPVDLVEVLCDGALPVDCPHDHARLWDGWVRRADGGKDCHQCAGCQR